MKCIKVVFLDDIYCSECAMCSDSINEIYLTFMSSVLRESDEEE